MTVTAGVDVDNLFQEIMEEIRWSVANKPRDLQTRIGPSEIGEPCDRTLIHKLMELPEPPRRPNWQAWVGTCMHVELADIFSGWNWRNTPTDQRFLLEERVTVGPIADWPLEGSCDLFDGWTGTVWDWKSKSKTQHAYHRRNGMGQKYRVQFHSYGLGMENAGHTVTTVGGIFLLRDGELSDTYQLSEPYDRNIALAALERANQLHALATLIGAEAAENAYPLCEDLLCRTCGPLRPVEPKAPLTLAAAVAAGTPKGP